MAAFRCIFYCLIALASHCVRARLIPNDLRTPAERASVFSRFVQDFLNLFNTWSQVPLGHLPSHLAPPPTPAPGRLLRDGAPSTDGPSETQLGIEPSPRPTLSNAGIPLHTVLPRMETPFQLFLVHWLRRHPNEAVELCDNVRIHFTPEGRVQFDALLQPFGLVCVILDLLSGNRVNPPWFRDGPGPVPLPEALVGGGEEGRDTVFPPQIIPLLVYEPRTKETSQDTPGVTSNPLLP